MQTSRFLPHPIIVPEMDSRMGANVNGPSLIRVPGWIPNPLGRYYLYFAHHKGTYIRMAYSDRIEGPWKTYEPGTLHLDQTCCTHHIASPDVHVDHNRRRVRMYFHGVHAGAQRSFASISRDGLRFEAKDEPLGNSYFRVFRWAGAYYAIAMPGLVYRSSDGLSGFRHVFTLPTPRMRHTAVWLRGDVLSLFYSRIGDRPERILHSRLHLSKNVREWRIARPVSILAPETEYEGADMPLAASASGWAPERVRQLRDPAIFVENGQRFLLYSIAGERGIAVVEIK